MGKRKGFAAEIGSHPGLANAVLDWVPLPHDDRGDEIWACCPVHNEKTPSFKIDRTTGDGHCFGCGWHGSAFDLVMVKDGVDFREAMVRLAGKLGLELTPLAQGRSPTTGSVSNPPARRIVIPNVVRIQIARAKSEVIDALRVHQHCEDAARRNPDFSRSEKGREKMQMSSGALREAFSPWMMAQAWEHFSKFCSVFKSDAEREVQRYRPDFMDMPRERLTEEQEASVQVNEAAWEKVFKPALAGADHVKRYLDGRGIPQAPDFGDFGYARPERDWLEGELSKLGIGIMEAGRAGLFSASKDGEIYPRFVGRVMVPIRDRGGRIRGFGGRAIGEAKAKYLNTRDTEIFHKKELLFGLSDSIIKIWNRKSVLVVEGYMDAMVVRLSGFPNVVAAMGTSLTMEQAKMLHRCGDVVFCFDGDQAGRSAVLRAFPTLIAAGVWPREILLPDGDDPDTFVRRAGVPALEELLSKAPPVLDRWTRWVKELGLQEQINEVGGLIRAIRDPFAFDGIVSYLAGKGIRIDEEPSPYETVGGFHLKTHSEFEMEAANA